MSLAIPREPIKRSNSARSTMSRSTGSWRSSRQCNFTASADVPVLVEVRILVHLRDDEVVVTEMLREPLCRHQYVCHPVSFPRRSLGNEPTYGSKYFFTAASSSFTETVPSNRSRTLPSAPTRKTHGSDGMCHSLNHWFSPFVGSLSW